MAGQKSFWKKYEFLIIAVLTVLFIYLLIVFNQKINFLLGNELIVYLTPNQKSFSIHYGDIGKFEFDVSVDNPAYCKAACSYSFNDRSRNNLIDKGNFELEKEQHFTKNYELSVKRLGRGQDIYSFDVQCSSIRSLFCITKGTEKARSSLVTVNYDLTEIEKGLKKVLKQNVTKLLELLADVDVMHQQVNQKYFESAHKINLKNLTKEKIEIDDKYDKLRVSVENLRSLWSTENYLELSKLFNESFFENLENTRKSIKNLDEKIDYTVEFHNNLLLKLNFLSDNSKELNIFLNILEDIETLNNFKSSLNKFDYTASSLINNTFESYDKVIEEIDNITKQQQSIIENTKNLSTLLFFNYRYSLNFQNDLLCSLNLSCQKNISVRKVIEDAEKFNKNYPEMTPLRQNCNLLQDLGQKYAEIRNETSAVIANKNISFPADDVFLNLANNFKDNEVRKINNSYYESFEKVKLENKTNSDAIRIAESMLPKNKTAVMTLDYNQSINLSLYLLSKINSSNGVNELLGTCSKLNKKLEEAGNFNFEPVSANITYKIISKINTTLSDNPPICCVFNECKPCCSDESCKNNPKTFPVIFVHGHSVATGNSPEFSLDAFNQLQAKLQNDGYLNAGNLLYSEEGAAEKGEWGLSGKPVTVKVTYYYDIYRKEDRYVIVPTKSESIDTYALRLNDIVNVVKYKTGKPKVNIIAFSMGGLVARKYMQIFGDESVNKFIAIGSPNQGIIGNVAGLCPVFGESKECIDMQQNSLFLNRLNDPARQPSTVKIFNIIGKGCFRDGKDSDGIVLAEQASLNGIANAKEFFVNGTCSKFGYFHTELVDVDKYPQVYQIISEILKE